MFQFYYAEKTDYQAPTYSLYIHDYIRVDAVKPAVWEEHCLECSAPDCYATCALYELRRDGRCKRTYNGIEVRYDSKGCCRKAVHLKFKKWSNLLMVINPAMLSWKDYLTVYTAYERLGNGLRYVIDSKICKMTKWGIVRGIEYCRRFFFRYMKRNGEAPDAFVFHGFSYGSKSFRLIMEVYSGKKSIYKRAIMLDSGENLVILENDQLDPCCWKSGNIMKIYPEGDYEAELDILWMDFVKGEIKKKRDEKIKCVVWDLDDTLWDGILAEMDDISTIKVKDDVAAFIKYLDVRGIIQSVASKNDYGQAWSVIKRLGLDGYFLYPQINEKVFNPPSVMGRTE